MLGRQGRVGCYCRLPPPAPAAGPCCGWRRPPAWCDVLAAGLGKQLQRHPCCPLSCPPARLLPQAGGWAGHAGGPPARVAVHQLGARPGYEPSPGRRGGALCGRQQRCVCVRVCACACAMSVPCALHVPQCVAGWHAAGQSADRRFVGWIAAAAGPSRKQPPHHICSCYRSRHPTHPPAPPANPPCLALQSRRALWLSCAPKTSSSFWPLTGCGSSSIPRWALLVGGWARLAAPWRQRHAVGSPFWRGCQGGFHLHTGVAACLMRCTEAANPAPSDLCGCMCMFLLLQAAVDIVSSCKDAEEACRAVSPPARPPACLLWLQLHRPCLPHVCLPAEGLQGLAAHHIHTQAALLAGSLLQQVDLPPATPARSPAPPRLPAAGGQRLGQVAAGGGGGGG